MLHTVSRQADYMNKVRITTECCRDTPSPSNCQNRLLKTTRREKPIPGGRKRKREGEREKGPSKYKKQHCNIWHMRNLSVYSVWQTSVNFSWPRVHLLRHVVFPDVVRDDISQALREFFLPTCNEFQIQCSCTLHLSHGTMLNKMVYNMSWIPSNISTQLHSPIKISFGFHLTKFLVCMQ
jgi:hypothetical protein